MVEKLTKESFLQKFAGFKNDKDWKFEGDKPMLIKFLAKWCGPCRAMNPIIDQISEEYKDMVDIYEVDTDEQSELATLFKIKSIPTLIFFPINEMFFSKVGSISTVELKKLVEKYLLKAEN